MRTSQGEGTINNFSFKNINNNQENLNYPYNNQNYQVPQYIIEGKNEYQINNQKNNYYKNKFNKTYEIPLESNIFQQRYKFYDSQRSPNNSKKEIEFINKPEEEINVFNNSINEGDSVSLKILETEKVDEIKSSRYLTNNVFNIRYSKTPNKTIEDMKKNVKFRKENSYGIIYNKQSINKLKNKISNNLNNGGKIDLYNKKGLYGKICNKGENNSNNLIKSESIDKFNGSKIMSLLTLHKKYDNLETLQKIKKLNKEDKDKISSINKNKQLNKKYDNLNYCLNDYNKSDNKNIIKEKTKTIDKGFNNFTKSCKNCLTQKKKPITIYKNNNVNKINKINTKSKLSQYATNLSTGKQSLNTSIYSKNKNNIITPRKHKTTNNSILKEDKSSKKLDLSSDMENSVYKKKFARKSNNNSPKNKKLKIPKLKLSLFCNKTEEKQEFYIDKEILFSDRNFNPTEDYSKNLYTTGKIITMPNDNNCNTISSCKNLTPVKSIEYFKYNEYTQEENFLRKRSIDNNFDNSNNKIGKDYNMTNQREKCVNLNFAKNETPEKTDFEIDSNFNIEFKPLKSYKSQKILFNRKIKNKSNEEYFLSINVEDLLILEEKLNDIFHEFLINKIIANECFEFWNYFFNCEIYKNINTIFYSDKNFNLQLSENIKFSINYLLMCILVFYDFSFDIELLDKAYSLIKKTMELMHINFLLLCKYILTKINSNQKNNNWVLKLNRLRSQIYSYINNGNNNLDFYENKDLLKKVIANSDIISKNLFNILNNYKSNSNISLMTLYKKLKTKTYKELDEFFKSFLIREENINGSILVSLFLSTYPNFKTEVCPYIIKPNKKKYTLVLDLEETLLNFKLNPENRSLGEFNFRPGLFEFLEKIEKYYELIIFTASSQDYADPLINAIEENKKYFDYKFYRQHNIIIDNDFVKDLTRIGRPLEKIIIVDNMPQNYRLQKENGILIKGFWGEENSVDNVLNNLCTILINIANEGGDLRVELEKYHEGIISYVTTYLYKFGI